MALVAGGRVAGPGAAEAARWWLRMMRNPLETYGALGRRYGDAIREPVGRQRALYVLSRPEYAEQMLVANQANYVKALTYRPLPAVLGDALLTTARETWHRRRRS